MTENNSDNPFTKALRIDRVIPEELKNSRFVNDLVVQHQPEYFILSFFEILQPLILGDTEEELQEALSAVDKVEATCVTRLVVTPQVLRQFIETMSQNLEKYEAKYSSLPIDEVED